MLNVEEFFFRCPVGWNIIQRKRRGNFFFEGKKKREKLKDALEETRMINDFFFVDKVTFELNKFVNLLPKIISPSWLHLIETCKLKQ